MITWNWFDTDCKSEWAIFTRCISFTGTLLSSLGHLGVRKATSIRTFDFSTIHTSIPHDLLKSGMNNIINNVFKHENGASRYTHIKVGRNKSYFTNDPLKMVTANTLPVTSVKWLNFWWITYMLGLMNSFSDKWLTFLWEQTVPHYWLTCFSIPTRMSFWVNSLKRAKEACNPSYHIFQ